MVNEQERAQLLERDGLLIGIAALSLLNGMHFSPYLDPFSILLRPIAAGFFITSPLVFFYIASLLLSATSLIISGVPAALYERYTGQTASDGTSLKIWFATSAVLAIPTALFMIGVYR
jgi:hypothetical protein